MLSEDIRTMEDWWRSVLLGAQECTPEACELILDGLKDARIKAAELEQHAITPQALQSDTPAEGNVVHVNFGSCPQPSTSDGGNAA